MIQVYTWKYLPRGLRSHVVLSPHGPYEAALCGAKPQANNPHHDLWHNDAVELGARSCCTPCAQELADRVAQGASGHITPALSAMLLPPETEESMRW